MTDAHLTGLFAEGTAPERDAAFVNRVDARIGRARLGMRLLAFVVRSLLTVTLVATVLIAIRALEPALTQIAEDAPQFMGVPLPVILVVLAAGVAVRALRFVRFRLG